MKSIAEMINHFESGHATSDDVIRAREEIVNLQNRHPLVPYSADTEQSLAYNPNALVKRATTLCEQIREAFPEHGNAEALGCPRKKQGSINRFEAETIINTVCDRLRTSVPTVSPEQFNCPLPKHNV
jgi:hypothetical protein